MRPTIKDTMIGIAEILARRSTCSKLAVGCVLTDAKGRIIGTGYNGVPQGCVHCTDHPCRGATAPAGSDLCEAVHAEQNAMLQCREVDKIFACFCTHVPCLRCMKQLMNTPCREIWVRHTDNAEQAALKLLKRCSGRIYQMDTNEYTLASTY
jgi:dCMP deaminase